MGQLNWVTDPHLDFLNEDALTAFVAEADAAEGDALLISGDIAEADSLLPILKRFDETLRKPVYFVMGNHDYYGAEIVAMRERVRQWSRQSQRTKWLPDLGIVALSEHTALIGHSGWGDGGYGDFQGSNIRLNDYLRIENLVCDSKVELQARLEALGTEAADYIGEQLDRALASHNRVILLTHVPPFVESCWYNGEATLNEWTPHFTCRAVGDRLLELADQWMDKAIDVFCGHTHSGGVAHLRDNLTVVTGGAEYGHPALQTSVPFR